MKITYEKIFEVIEAFNSIRNVDDNGKEIKDKLTYASTRLTERLKSITKNYSTKLSDINVDCCMVDKDGIILEENGQYKFNKEGKRKRDKAIEDLKQVEVDLEPYICTDNSRVKDLPIWVQEKLNGILFNIEIPNF